MTRRLLLPLLLLGLLLSAGAARAVDALPAAPAVQSQLGTGGAWCWFSDPRAIHLPSPTPTTFTGWIDADGRIVVSAYDHTTQRVRRVTVRTSFFVDDHNNPSLLAHADGRISVFWSGHNGDAILVRTTERPGDIGTFGPVRSITAFAPGDPVVTYTNPVRLPGQGGRIVLFFRSGFSHQAFVTSDDDGATWSPATVLVENGRERPYVKYDGDGDRTVATAYTDGHPDELKTSVHYAALRDGVLRRADGSVLQALADGPLDARTGDLLWDAAATGVSGWVHDVALDAQGRPVVVFATIRSRTDHRYHYARWDGARWTVTELGSAGGSISAGGTEPSYSGGITLDHSDPSVLYLSRPGADPAIDEIERWQTPDGGTSWVAEALTHDSDVTNVRPVRPRGLPAGSAMDAVWMRGSYPSFTGFQTSLQAQAPVLSTAAAASAVRVSAASLVADRGTGVRLGARLVDATGWPAAGREVTLERRAPGTTAWRRVEERRTAVDGSVVFPVVVERTYEHRVVWPGDEALEPSTSPVVQVAVAPARSVLRSSVRTLPGQVQLSVRLLDAAGRSHGDRPVVLSGRAAGATAWTTLARVRTRTDGLAVHVRGLLRPTEYRWTFAGDAGLLPSSGPVLAARPAR